jgi:hypothetical protein
MVVTSGGMDIEVRLLQALNAVVPMVVTSGGMDIEVKGQLVNALIPMVVN